jgi:NAD(P)-dependent dehydrogenase (short-subunit alcohol dehydrogenase family)
MDKKIALVTGATAGIGLETAKGLIEKGFFVIGTSRSDEKEKKAMKYLGENCYFIKADLSSQKSIQDLVTSVKNLVGDKGLDILINNAGSFYSYYSLSDEGVEKQFAVNTVAPFYLSLLLYDKLTQNEGRIINVNSGSHYRTSIRWNDIQLSRRYGQLKAYKQSKILSVMISREFNKYSKAVKTYMADPGLVNTNMGFKNTSGLSKFIWSIRKNKGVTPREGAATSIFLATEKILPTDLYYRDCKVKNPDKKVYNDEYTKRIWDYCQSVLNIDAKEYMGL